jgi:hypothetical protein
MKEVCPPEAASPSGGRHDARTELRPFLGSVIYKYFISRGRHGSVFAHKFDAHRITLLGRTLLTSAT